MKNPLEDSNSTNSHASTRAPFPGTSFGAPFGTPSPFSESAPTTPGMSKPPVPSFSASPSPTSFGGSSSSIFAGTPARTPGFGSQSAGGLSSGFGANSTPSAPSTQSFGSPGVGVVSTGFGGHATPAPSFANQGGSISSFGSPSAAASFGSPSPLGQSNNNTFGGKSPREILIAFYSKYAPDKISEVDKILNKYKNQESLMFSNLCKKYQVHPSVFGMSQTPAAPSSASSGGFAQFASSAASFGSLAQSGNSFSSPTSFAGSSPFGSATPFGAPRR